MVAGAAAVVAVASLAALTGFYWPAVWDGCVLERDALLNGQVWRLWTGHLMHLDLRHAGINLAALAILAVTAARWRLLGPLMLASTLLLPAISLALLQVLQHLQWYVGLSGVLHGWVAWLLLMRRGRLMWVGLGVLLLKLGWEWVGGGADLRVIHDAHWPGAVLGAVLAWPSLRYLSAKSRDFPATT